MASSWRNIQDEDDDEEEEFRPEVCAHSTLTSNPRGGSENPRAPPDPDPNDARPRGGVPTFLPPSSDDRGLTERPPAAPQPPQSDRESIVFLIDASPAMFRPAPASIAASGDNRVATHTTAGGSSRSFVDVAVDCARSVLRSRIVSTPNDRQGVAFFATTNARGTADDAGAGAGGGARENVWVEQRMNVPSARRIQDLADLVGADGNRRLRDKIGVAGGEENTDGGDDGNRTRDGVASYYDALLRAHHVAREMLNDHAPGAKVRKRLLLFTNRDAPLAGGRGRTDASSSARGVSSATCTGSTSRCTRSRTQLAKKATGIATLTQPSFTNISPRATTTTTTTKDEARTPTTETPSRRGASSCRTPAATSSSPAPPIASTASPRRFKKIAKAPASVRTASLRFGSDENDAIAVALFAPAAEAKKPKAVNVHAKDLTELHAETRHIASADGAYVSRENLTRRFVDLGDSAGRAILTPADVADARRACDREGIHLLGFRPRGAIGRWARTSKPARLMVPEEESRQAGSTAAFTALCEAMVAKDRVAIAAYARTDDRFAGVRCVALVPCVEAAEAADDDDDDDANDLKIIGLHVVDLPYLDDVRHPELAHATGGVVAGRTRSPRPRLRSRRTASTITPRSTSRTRA